MPTSNRQDDHQQDWSQWSQRDQRSENGVHVLPPSGQQDQRTQENHSNKRAEYDARYRV